MEAPIRMTMMKVLNETVNILTSQRSRMLPLSSQHLLRGEKKNQFSALKFPSCVDCLGEGGGRGDRSEKKFKIVKFISHNSVHQKTQI